MPEIFNKKRYLIGLLLMLNGLSAWMLCFKPIIYDLLSDPSGNIYLKRDIAIPWCNHWIKMSPNGKKTRIQLRNNDPIYSFSIKQNTYKDVSGIVMDLTKRDKILAVKQGKTLFFINSQLSDAGKEQSLSYYLTNLSYFGDELWRIKLPFKYIDSVGGMACDKDGNLFVAFNTRWGYSVIKWDAAGRLMWRRNVNPKKSMIWGIFFVLLVLVRNGIKLKIVGYKKLLQRLDALIKRFWGRANDVHS